MGTALFHGGRRPQETPPSAWRATSAQDKAGLVERDAEGQHGAPTANTIGATEWLGPHGIDSAIESSSDDS